MIQAEKLCFLIADISGYTEYLSAVEIDHAQDILADLVGTVVSALRPTFRLAKLEGDAAFCVAPADKVDASLLLDTIERCYFGFRRRRRDVRQATACECRACVRIPNLDLKFVAHGGLSIRQRVAGHEELLGSDVIVVHRLLKNDIVEKLHVPAYAALTGSLVESLGIDPAALQMIGHTETYEHVGDVALWVLDLERRWQEEDIRERVLVGPADALYDMQRPIAAPPQVVWEFVTTPGRRVMWQAPGGVIAVEQHQDTGGRRGAGTVSHCVHGPNAWIEEILDWRPFDYVTQRTRLPGGGPAFVSTYEFEPTASGTILHFRLSAPTERDRAALDVAGPEMTRVFETEVDLLESMTGQEAQTRRTERSEPPLPQKNGRDGFLAGVAPIQMLDQ